MNISVQGSPVEDLFRVSDSAPIGDVPQRWDIASDSLAIERSVGFNPGGLVDVGANVGLYSVFAGVTRGVNVFAFEPESQNFATLNRNIIMNELEGRVRAWPAALSDEESFSVLHLSRLETGASGHAIKEPRDGFLREARFRHTQGSISTTLDRLIADGVVDFPDHIKIDVDGFEHKVIAGARDTLRNPRLQSLLVELNTKVDEHRAVVEELVGLGFAFDQAQVDAAMRRDEVFGGLAEHLFRRKA